MKAMGNYLYNRNGNYYFRFNLPEHISALVLMREVVIALGTRDTLEARLYCAQIACQLDGVMCSLSRGDSIDLPEKLEEIKSSIGIKSYRKPNYMSDQGYKVVQEVNGVQNISFSYVVEEYLKDCVSECIRTKQKKKAVFDMFREIMGDIPLSKIKREHARQFKSLLLKIPSNIKRQMKTDSYADIDWKNLPKGQPLSHVTINLKLACLGALFNWAKQNDLFSGDNPFSHLSIKATKTRQRDPFSKEQLRALFDSPIYTGCQSDSNRTTRVTEGEMIIKDALYWIPIVALYTGMRMNEICQLERADIKQQDGIWFIDVNDEGQKSLKNKSSVRIIPIHQSLIEKCFLDHVRTKKGRIFDDIKLGNNGTYSYTFSKQFTHSMKLLGLRDERVCFHSFRHNFIDGLREGGVDKHIAMKLVGHQGENTIHDSYGFGYSLQSLQESINKLRYSF